MPAQVNPPSSSNRPVYPSVASSHDPRENNLPYSLHPTAAAVPANVYPELGGYMGMEFDEQTIRQNMPEYLPNVQQQVAVRPQVSFSDLYWLYTKVWWVKRLY